MLPLLWAARWPGDARVQRNHQPVRAPARRFCRWYRAARSFTVSLSSRANSARSAAEAKTIWLSMANVATGWPAARARVISSPTSPTSRAARASSHRAESWSEDRPGSGATAARAAGEIT